MEKIVIFGAGNVGRMALKRYLGRVAYFIDNNKSLQGKEIDGIPIKSVCEFMEDKDKYKLVIASYSQHMMEKQIKDMGISNYETYLGEYHRFYEIDDLIFNPYEDNVLRDVSEVKYNDSIKTNLLVQAVNDEVKRLMLQSPLDIFSLIEIETINRCNGNCDFCPVSAKNDIRTYQIMDKKVFEGIINQLSEMDYSGRLSLFSNNEPFLDPDIISRHKYAREMVPRARMHLFTNGTLLTIERFQQIMEYLDELIIDNYQQELKLIKPCEQIVEYCEKNPELKKKVTIVLRKPHEILSSRGGDAPNRKNVVNFGNDSCVLPFKQMTIRPDGKVSLCCSDALGKNTLGDVTKNSLLEIWYGDEFQRVRNCLKNGRKNWELCKKCDFFVLRQ